MSIRWNLWVLSRIYRWLPALVLIAAMAENASAQQWYRSNPAGMALEPVLSRLAALRNNYCLSIEFPPPGELPAYVQEYHRPSYRIELHTLYENGQESRRRWIFRDTDGVTRLVSSLNLGPGLEEASQPVLPVKDTSEGEPPRGEEPSGREPATAPSSAGPAGFIEIYDAYNLITEERRFSEEGSENITAYFYNKQVLIKAETWLKTPVSVEQEGESNEPALTLITTDNYRYSRSNSLRAIERVYHEAVSADHAGEDRLTRLRFPHLGLNSRADEQFVTPGTPYKSEFLQDVIMDSGFKPGDRVVYTTDERGKVLTETRRDAEGAIRGEIRNIWAGDRLESIEWKAGSDERRTEYEYDRKGEQVFERNYNKGALERTVRRENGREIEELYMNGAVILRAIWEEGRKISEERIRPSRTGER
jgi:hypothetical protein